MVIGIVKDVAFSLETCDKGYMLNHTEIGNLKAERTALLARIEEMQETLDGCDWCCGGGDQEIGDLYNRLDEIKLDLEDLAQPTDDYAEGGYASKRDQDRGYVNSR